MCSALFAVFVVSFVVNVSAVLHYPVTHGWVHALHVNVPVETSRLAKLLPDGVVPDVFNQTSWITLLASHIVSTRFVSVFVCGVVSRSH